LSSTSAVRRMTNSLDAPANCNRFSVTFCGTTVNSPGQTHLFRSHLAILHNCLGRADFPGRQNGLLVLFRKCFLRAKNARTSKVRLESSVKTGNNGHRRDSPSPNTRRGRSAPASPRGLTCDQYQSNPQLGDTLTDSSLRFQRVEHPRGLGVGGLKTVAFIADDEVDSWCSLSLSKLTRG
jgi:hypothetical protein